MSEPSRPGAIPPVALWGAAGLIGFTILAAGIGRVSGIGVAEVPAAQPIDSIELRFEDQPNGAVAVYQLPQGKTVAILAPGTNGFVRGVLRGLARERRQHDIGVQPPFKLTRWGSGGLSLEDPTTGRRIELEAFGQTNVDACARLLARGSEAS
jgi:putative photosynthetic complex assembly protein